jgi:hypothetical protein
LCKFLPNLEGLFIVNRLCLSCKPNFTTMSYTSKSPGSFLRSIASTHLLLLTGQLLFALFACARSSWVYFGPRSSNGELIFAVPLLAFCAIIADHVLFKQQLKALCNKNTLSERLSGYHGALMMRFALLGFPSIVATIAYMFNKNVFFIGIATPMMLYFTLLRPTREKVEIDLHVDFSARVQAQRVK